MLTVRFKKKKNSTKDSRMIHFIISVTVTRRRDRDIFERLCTMWNHFYNLKNVKKTNGGKILLVKLHFATCNFNKSKTLPTIGVLHVFKIGEMVPNRAKHHIYIH